VPLETGTITITTFGAAGDSIDGTFAIDMSSQSTPGGPTLPLSGSFHVCHRPDVSSP